MGYEPHSETCSVQEMGLCGVRKGMEDTVGTREGLPRYGTGRKLSISFHNRLSRTG